MTGVPCALAGSRKSALHMGTTQSALPCLGRRLEDFNNVTTNEGASKGNEARQEVNKFWWNELKLSHSVEQESV